MLDPTQYKDWQIAEEAEKTLPSVEEFRKKMGLLEDEIIPSGGFCFGKCNRQGVTLQVDDDIFPGITPESFDAFFNDTILPRAHAQR